MIGEWSYIKTMGPASFVIAQQGLFRLHGDIRAERVLGLPTDRQDMAALDIAYLEEPALFVMLFEGQNRIYTSQDLRQFDALVAPTAIQSFETALPDRPALLLSGETGLYTLETFCDDGD